ncbi:MULTISPECIES: 4Fe-4S binding protein [Dehalobacter]|uniref:4Fe-4S ferredoxin n=1 Tax=Dehalobacter restrictus TaxID=55583 RepID=A0A857DDE8_9FIRM|nr:MULTISPECIES: 4Fe-4S binding protein [Dehalobacter]QGZ99249.1 4Fe-4S ferredoxin [Dehalobacter restrictus]
MAIVIDKNRCPENHPCPSVKVCPVNALIQQRYKAPKVDAESCIECNKCVNYCPMGAIKNLAKVL